MREEGRVVCRGREHGHKVGAGEVGDCFRKFGRKEGWARGERKVGSMDGRQDVFHPSPLE